jgi:hypothetical protein
MFSRNEIRDPNAKPSRKAWPYYELEEFRPNGGMWQTPKPLDRERFIQASEELMADPGKFYDACAAAAKAWPRSTEQALTTPGMNHRAWLGHAACFLTTGSPEETTRLGWHNLDDAEQYAANHAADQAITEWRAKHEGVDLFQIPLWGDDA